jgi:uncharacterized membrane protein
MSAIPTAPAEGVTCPRCGGANAPDAVFCARPDCGHGLGEFRYVRDVVAARGRWPERAAARVVAFVGRSHFFVVHGGWFVAWIAVNTGLVALARPFDAYPFGLLGLLLAIEAILLTGFLLISQNRERQQEAIQAEIAYEVSVRTYRRLSEIEALVRELVARDRGGS